MSEHVIALSAADQERLDAFADAEKVTTKNAARRALLRGLDDYCVNESLQDITKKLNNIGEHIEALTVFAQVFADAAEQIMEEQR